MSDLIERLRNGVVCHPKRWSGDTHDDLGGTIKEAETDALMDEAAEMIEKLTKALERIRDYPADVTGGLSMSRIAKEALE